MIFLESKLSTTNAANFARIVGYKRIVRANYHEEEEEDEQRFGFALGDPDKLCPSW